MYNGTDPTTDGIHDGIEPRKQRGLEIAALARIDRDGDYYLVPSVTNPRQTKYKVKVSRAKQTCTCPDHELRGCKCKHIYAVEYAIRRERHPDGSTTVTESVTVTKERRTYPQDWPAYNEAQTNEKREFQFLLRDLCATVTDFPPRPDHRGRPPIPLRDAIFAAVFKVYSTVSARRFMCDLSDAHERGYIKHLPHFNSVLNALEDPRLFPVLTDLIERSALPLSAIESTFAVDSTGFCASKFIRWYDVKYNRFTSEQQWVKAHFACGVKTNVVTAIEIQGRDTGDATQLPALVQNTARNFAVKEVVADKGYSGRDCPTMFGEILRG